MTLKQICVLFVLLLLPVFAHPGKGIYKCLDRKGHVVFSDHATACATPEDSDGMEPLPLDDSTVPLPTLLFNSLDQAARTRLAQPILPSAPLPDKAYPVAEPESGFVQDYLYPPRQNHSSQRTLGFILIVIGLLMSVVYGVILLIATFRYSILWGLASLFIPLAQILFIVRHWHVAKQPVLRTGWALPPLLLGVLLIHAALKQAHLTQAEQAKANQTIYRCEGKTRCIQMTSCSEAYFYLQHCPGVEIDGDYDGIPCEDALCSN